MNPAVSHSGPGTNSIGFSSLHAFEHIDVPLLSMCSDKSALKNRDFIYSMNTTNLLQKHPHVGIFT